ncbi:recombinase family protein [Sphingomonas endolithica]|uniref:recombinase family protein n=1 Tax=Sphingomonas endolithica TaxID=2972485 RepID=UPI0021AFF636|nr:recombinase family protein [Sphingomonas sp. ZFBP2030]
MNRVRCAIYTRKSSEEGLEQAFNSLDAQREACAAYVLSQASEGWSALPDIYDDGGLSGGSLERPALQRLLADIAAGRVDIIVVYKVDRLTRSLLDFAKLVEVFDKAGVSFVSITQSFNTTTSMGRLTLNILLSFAQFEREVTAERIRDKIAASKAKGMWMGGVPPLGYRPDGRTLAIVEPHAEIVREIYRRYLNTGNVRLVVEQLAAERILAPVRHTSGGRAYGGIAFCRGQIYSILKSPIYIGEIAHREVRYKGQHQPIIDRATWDAVQARLDGNVPGERRATNIATTSLLAGLIVDEAGEPLVAAHACKGKVRYRYYVSRARQDGDPAKSIRLRAREIENAVVESIAAAFDDPLDLIARAGMSIAAADLQRIFAAAGVAAATMRQRSTTMMRSLVTKVMVGAHATDITMSSSAVAEQLATLWAGPKDATFTLTLPVRITRTGRTLRLIQNDGRAVAATPPDASIIKLLVKAHRWWARLRQGDITVRELAEAEGVVKSYVTRVTRLAFLSPAIVDDILAGRQRAELDAKRLALTADLPTRWSEQQETWGVTLQ